VRWSAKSMRGYHLVVVKILIPTELFGQTGTNPVNFDSNNRLGDGQ